MKSVTLPFEYRLRRQSEKFGDVEVAIDTLANLDETIDALFDFLQKDGRESLLEELCPYFGVVWPSARALTEYLLQENLEAALQGARVLEVGCGLAIPSLALASRGAHVTATDFHPEVPRFLEGNRKLNPGGALTYLHLDWQRTSLASVCPEKFNWVVGSDILYEKQQPALVAQVMHECLAPGGTVVLADPGRPYLQGFADEMKKRGFTYETHIKTVRDAPLAKDIFLLVFRRA